MASAPPTRWNTVPNTAIATAVPGTPRAQPVTPRRLDLGSGMTPLAKRPMSRDTIQIAVTGERPLTHDELTSGFYALLRRVDREEAFGNEMREAMIYNAELIDHCGTRSGENRVALDLIPTQIDQTIIGLQNNISEAVTNFDARLRAELDGVVAQIDMKLQQQYATLGGIIGAIGEVQQSTAGSSSTSAAPGFDWNTALAELKKELAELRQTFVNMPNFAGRLDDLRKEASDAHSVLKTELHTTAELARRALEMAGSNHQSGVSGNRVNMQEKETPTTIDPFQTGPDPWQGYGGNSGTGGPQGPSPPPGFDSPSRDRSGRWFLYDEKVHLNGKMSYDTKKPEVWLQDLRDYVAGRTRELDQLLDWIEKQTDEITMDSARRAYVGCLDCATIDEVSRQLWSFIGPLIKENAEKASIFRNVARHNGLEAWRRIAEPINDDKSLMRKDLLPLVNNPRGATTIEDLEAKLEVWNTNCRLMLENGGALPDDESRRVAFIEMLPDELSVHATMRLDDPDFDSFTKVKKWALKYGKVLLSTKARKKRGPLNMVDLDKLVSEQGSQQGLESEEDDDEDWVTQQAELLSNMRENGVNQETQVAVLAIMRGRFQKKPGGGGNFRNGQRTGGGGGGQRPDKPGARPGAPPRGVQDLSCVNCGEKGHIAGNCPNPPCKPEDRPCFRCKKKGHRSFECPDKGKKPERRPVHAVENGRTDAQGNVLCVDFPRPPDADGFVRPRRYGRLQFGDFAIAPAVAPKQNKNRYRALQESDRCVSGCCKPQDDVAEPGVRQTMNAEPGLGQTSDRVIDPVDSSTHWPTLKRHVVASADTDYDRILWEHWMHYMRNKPTTEKEPVWGSNAWKQWVASIDMNVAPESIVVSPPDLEESECDDEGYQSPVLDVPIASPCPCVSTDIADIVYSLADSDIDANRAVLRAVANVVGDISDQQIENWLVGKSERQIDVPHRMRDLLSSMNLGHVLAPLNLLEAKCGASVFVTEEEQWREIDIEVALDSGSVCHVASMADTPCYTLDGSAKARPCAEFIVGDGGAVPNLGQKTLNLSCDKSQFSSVFQIAPVHRPLMSVGRMCDNGNEVLFKAERAVVRNAKGVEVCIFDRQPGGLYVAKLKLLAPFQGQER